MTDDIVTRLHLEADEWVFDGPVRIFIEAADEIQRLRNELAVSKHKCQMADDAVRDLQARLLDALRQLKGTQK